MAKQELRLAELYPSIQCEGPRTGIPTQFVRFAGCNYRCPGWPCDTEFAIEPSIFLKSPDTTKPTPEELMVRIRANRPTYLCLTGGEPLLQPKLRLQEFVELANSEGYTMEMFTNGAFEIPYWALNTMTFVMDWKLEGSGEGNKDIQVRTENALRLKRSDSIKFVIKTKQDLFEAVQVTENLMRTNPFQAKLWAGVVWGSEVKEADLAEFIVNSGIPWRMNVQMHKYIWDPEERGV